ncbi:MAG: methyltransferase family protein [Burkholderiales bacterium]
MAALSYNERVTTSASTPRIQLTQALYLLVLALVAASDGRLLQGACALLAQSAGFLLVVGAVLGRLWTTLFIAGRKEERLVCEGPYARCRHPLYLCSVIGALGLGLTSLSLTLTLVLPSFVAVIVATAARREDAVLLATHGHAWREYRDSVPAFWPGRSRTKQPESIAVPPQIYRKAFLDAASFLGLWLLVLLIEGLRAAGAWQAFFRLP